MTTAIILAGGLGTRLRSAVPDLPKPMAPIAGKPFLEHQLDFWIAQGVRHFILSVGYKHEAISRHFGHRFHGATIDYAIENTPRGTGGALLLAAAQLPDDAPALLLNGDTYFDVRLDDLAARATKHGAHWCFALFRHDDPARYMGVALSRDGRITELKSPAAPQANGGVYWFRPAALRPFAVDGSQPLSLENDLFPRLLAGGQRFAGLVCGGAFVDIGVPADYQRAAGVLAPGETRHAIAG